jgi:hypothetical protein
MDSSNVVKCWIWISFRSLPDTEHASNSNKIRSISSNEYSKLNQIELEIDLNNMIKYESILIVKISSINSEISSAGKLEEVVF